VSSNLTLRAYQGIDFWLVIASIIFIPIFGLILEAYYPDEDVFARSGAALIMFVLLMAATKSDDITAVEKAKEWPSEAEEILELIRLIPEDQVKERQELENSLEDLSKIITLNNTHAHVMLTTLGKAEVWGGIAGTFIWGFGDWIGSPLIELIQKAV